MPRIAVVGNTNSPYSLETFLLRAAIGLGYDALGMHVSGGRTMLSPKVPNQMRRWMWRRQLQGLASAVAEFSSRVDDVLLLVKCASLLNDTEHLIRVLDAWRGRVVLVAPDRLDTFCGREALRLLIERGAAIGTYDVEVELAEYGSWLGPGLMSYDFGYDKDAHWRPVDDSAQRIDEIVFVGTWDVERDRLICELGRHVPVAVYGPYWGRSRRHSGVRLVSAEGLFGQAQAAVVTKYALTLNIPRSQNRRSGNMRTFETPAQGGFPANAHGAKILEGGIWAADLSDLTPQIDAWMTTPRPKRVSVLRAAQAEVAPYTYESRLRDLMDTLAANPI